MLWNFVCSGLFSIDIERADHWNWCCKIKWSESRFILRAIFNVLFTRCDWCWRSCWHLFSRSHSMLDMKREGDESKLCLLFRWLFVSTLGWTKIFFLSFNCRKSPHFLLRCEAPFEICALAEAPCPYKPMMLHPFLFGATHLYDWIMNEPSFSPEFFLFDAVSLNKTTESRFISRAVF